VVLRAPSSPGDGAGSDAKNRGRKGASGRAAGADPPPDKVGDASPLAAPYLEGPESERIKRTRVVSADISLWTRIAEIWRCRELLIHLVRNEIRVKYKNSVLGFLWSMLSPAMNLLVYFMVFHFIARNGIPNFVIFLFAGLLVWNLFNTAVLTGTSVIVANSGIVKKVSFPREILALAAVGTASVFFFFQACVMVIFMVIFHSPPIWHELPLLVYALVICMVLAAAFAVFLAAVNVYLRDMQHLVEVLLTAWFWACPIVYSYQKTVASFVTRHHLVWLYFLNPMTPLVVTFQKVIYAKEVVKSTIAPHAPFQILPSWHGSVYWGMDTIVLVCSLLALLFALWVFGRLEGNFAEEL
jgi:ABC-2 type transport system permease protein